MTKKYVVMGSLSVYEGTDIKVAQILNSYLNSYNERIRIFYGDKNTGRDWLEEYDNMGYIGRTTGNNKVPILIKTRNSSGGGAISTDSIVKIMVGKRVLYKHPKYHCPQLKKQRNSKGYSLLVKQLDGKIVTLASFEHLDKLEKYHQYLLGERHSK